MPSIILSDNGVSSGSAGLKSTAGNDGILVLQTTTSGGTATNAVYIDAAQNVGLGVTPSAWGSGLSALQIGAVTAVVNRSNQASFYSNTYYDGTNFRSLITGYGGRYRIVPSTGEHAWDTIASVSAGSVQTVTQAMTLNASGNLGVGTTSPSAKLTVNDSNNIPIRLGDITSAPVSQTAVYVGASTSGFTGGNGDLVLIPRTSGANSIIFYTGNGTASERARIDSDGVLLVNRTSYSSGIGSSCKFQVLGTNGEWTSVLENSNGTSPYGLVIKYSGAATNNSSYPFLYALDTSSLRFQVYSNGGIANYQANNTNLSDRREKTNFAPAGDYLEKICAIPVQTFNYIDQNLEEDNGLTLGVVAQDVQAVAPELVIESNWASKDEEPKMRLSVYQTDLQYALMKSIQELKAIVDAQAAEIAALKGN